MEAFLISFGTVALAEIGDRTQLLSLVLAAHFRQPLAIIGGILVATLANHLLAGVIGVLFGRFLTQAALDGIVGVSMMGMALWSLKQDTLDDAIDVGRSAAFLATVTTFFIAEIGDKTQIATAMMAAEYHPLWQVVAGTTTGMLLADIPAVWLGARFAQRLPLKAARIGTALLFAAIAVWILVKPGFS